MRRPTVAGQFYPSAKKNLKRELNRCFSIVSQDPGSAIGAIVPHAGYTYSGTTAAYVYAVLPQVDTYIILGPNHTGLGSMVAVSREIWSTPFGEVPVDMELAGMIIGGIIDSDETAHRYEHSIEVQLPFLQYSFSHDFSIVPICMGLQDRETALEIADQIVQAVKKINSNVVVIASSDFSHYIPDNMARDIDNYLIESIVDLDIDEFYLRLTERNASVCGYGPISVMLGVSKALDASTGTLLNYATSGDVSGDTTGVVGYAGIIIE